MSILIAALVALSIGAVPGAMAKSSSSSHVLRFKVVKRTSHYDVVKGHSHRFGVRRGAHKVTVRGFGRFKLVRRTPHFVFLRAYPTRSPSPTVTPTPSPMPPPSSACQFGVHMDLTYNGDAWQRAQAVQAVHDVLHVQIGRNSLLWPQVESVRGQRDWNLTDAVVAELASGGIEPLFAIYGSPSWANGVPESTNEYYLYVPTAEGAFEAWLAGYVGFVKEAVTRYQGSVHKWEIGNEENEHYFWKPKPNPSQYARFYTALRDAILSVDPQAQVAMGGLAGLLYCGPEDYSGMDFLKAMNARGIYPENVAIHPYCSKNQPPTQHIAGEGNFDDIQAIRDYLKTVNRPASIWVTEWGWPVGAVTEEQQADYMRTSLNMIRSEYTYVTVATAFFDHDRPPFSYGLFDGDFNPRPAAYAFGSFVDSLQ